MKRFSFTLEGALRFRRALCRAREADMHAAAATLRLLEMKFNALASAVDGIRGDAASLLAPGCPASDAKRLWRLESFLIELKDETGRRRREAERLAEQAREALIAARRDARLLEKVRERRKDAHALLLRRLEQKENDDRTRGGADSGRIP